MLKAYYWRLQRNEEILYLHSNRICFTVHSNLVWSVGEDIIKNFWSVLLIQ
jgi:hypothetical protein